jgi:hypothetical protein
VSEWDTRHWHGDGHHATVSIGECSSWWWMGVHVHTDAGGVLIWPSGVGRVPGEVNGMCTVADPLSSKRSVSVDGRPPGAQKGREDVRVHLLHKWQVGASSGGGTSPSADSSTLVSRPAAGGVGGVVSLVIIASPRIITSSPLPLVARVVVRTCRSAGCRSVATAVVT